MFKRSIILLSFLAYSLTLVHSIVPHHHHDKPVSEHHHHDDSKQHHHHDDHEDKTVSHAFADAIHFPGSEVVIHAQTTDNIQKLSYALEFCSENIVSLLSQQLKPPDPNIGYRQIHYSAAKYSWFLLRAPPVA
jgi:hypothetical protein